jgi:predicted phage baseplate assembly protein
MTIQIPVLDDRTYDQLVAEARSRVPVHTPEWTNLNENDPGITLLELFAFLTDNLLYRSNRIPEANRLKFLSLLGIGLQPASPGVGLVTVSNDRGPLPPLAVEAGTEVTAGKVRFLTDTSLAVLPVTAVAYYKQPQQPDAATVDRYRALYQSFLETDSEVLTFYKPVALPLPATGRPDPVVDLGDPVNGTIDRSLWIGLLGQKGAALSDVRAAIAGQTLTIGVYPTATVPGQVVLPEHTGTPTADPGLVVEIASPASDPSDSTAASGLGIGPASYSRTPITYAEPVLDAPGLIQVTLPTYERLLLWDFDPEEEGTGDFPPRLDDPQVSSRLVTWVRLRYPPLGDDGSAAATDSAATASATTSPTVSAAGGDLSLAGCGCGCGDTTGTTGTGSTTAATMPGRVTWVGVNATRAVQAIGVRQESLGLAPGTPYHSCTLAHAPVLTTALPAAAEAVTVEVQDIDGTWSTWHQIDDILAATPEDQVFTLDRAAGTITFGSGLNGLRPVRGARIRASYWYGGGAQGRVAIDGLNKSTALPGGFSVTNPLPTWGAGDGESSSNGEAAITRWLRHRDRLVTSDDFRDLTRRTPGVALGRVEVLPLFNPEATGAQEWPGMVTVLVIPESDAVHPDAPVPDRQFLDAVCAWLAPRRLVTTELHVRGPVYVPVWVSVAVVPLAGQVPSLVNQAVTDAVRAFLAPLTGGLPTEPADDGLVGSPGTTGSGWPLGVSLRAQDVEAVATRVTGVRYVDSVQLAMVGPDGAVLSPVDNVPLTGLQLPRATVFCSAPPAADPAGLIAGSQSVAPTLVPVPVVPETC